MKTFAPLYKDWSADYRSQEVFLRLNVVCVYGGSIKGWIYFLFTEYDSTFSGVRVRSVWNLQSIYLFSIVMPYSCTIRCKLYLGSY